jgi:hypothetical protein
MSVPQHRIFDHVLIIIFENQYRSYVMKNPYMRRLAAQGINLANHFGNMHPSQTNYVSSIAGELCNITYDWPPYPPALSQRTIVDLIEESPHGLRWKAYLQSYVKMRWKQGLKPSDYPTPFPIPGEMWAMWGEPFNTLPQPPYPYAFFHNPFSLFEQVLNNPARWDKLEDESAFYRDLLTGDFPEYAWFSPNLWNDGHYTYGTCDEPSERAPALVDQQAQWLESFLGTLRFPGPDSLLPPRTLVVVTYDEADFEAAYDADSKSDYDGPNQIYTVLLGDMIKPGVREEGSNHYSVLKTIEKNFGLPSLGKNDHDSNWLQFLWGREFGWRQPAETPIVAGAAVTAAGFDGLLYVVYAGEENALKLRTFDGINWSAEQPVAGQSAAGVEMASLGNNLILVYKDDGGNLNSLTYTPDGGWSPGPQTIVNEPVGAFSVTAIDFNNTMMLAYAASDGSIYSMLLTESGWGEPIPVGFGTDGDLVLAVLGPSLYLIHKVVGNNQMNVVSYNTADFNVVTIASPDSGGSSNNTTRDAWSPSEYPVAYYWRGPNPVTPGEDEPLLRPYEGGTPLATATLDGVIHLAHPGGAGTHVLTETFSLSGIMTPANPVSYGSDDTDTSNGYGTLAEAGWSLQKPISGVSIRQSGGLTMARFGSRLALLFQPPGRETLWISLGGYGD